jgi:hypothetical protein
VQRPVRIANCSGFYGDRIEAAREMVEGGPIDVLTGDYLAELTGPDEDRWTWGPADAADRVTGPALDFCLAVTQRRHLDDLVLTITGPVATEWMSIAQAFAGPPGQGRQPGLRVPAPGSVQCSGR